MKNHIIFDMDGVIIDSEPEYQKRIKIFMKCHHAYHHRKPVLLQKAKSLSQR